MIYHIPELNAYVEELNDKSIQTIIKEYMSMHELDANIAHRTLSNQTIDGKVDTQAFVLRCLLEIDTPYLAQEDHLIHIEVIERL